MAKRKSASLEQTESVKTRAEMAAKKAAQQ